MENHVKRFKKITKHTEARELAYLYDEIPNEIEAICKVVNSLLIHPVRLSEYPELNVSEEEIWNNEPKTVYEILTKLKSKSDQGLLANRNAQEKVIITCRGFTILLTSILRYKGIPARARAGFAPYLCEGVNIDHWICEYWDIDKKKWILLDADFMKIDFSSDEFRYTADVYLNCNNTLDDPYKYGCDDWWGMCYIISYLNLDLLSLVYDELWYNPHTYITEKLVWEKHSNYDSAVINFTKDEKELINKVAKLMTDINKNYNELTDLIKLNDELLPIPKEK